MIDNLRGTTDRAASGLGLGLSIARHLVEQQTTPFSCAVRRAGVCTLPP